VEGAGLPDESLGKLFTKGCSRMRSIRKWCCSSCPSCRSSWWPSAATPSWQTAQLGLLFTAQAVLLFGLLGYFSGAVGAWINRTPSAGKWMDRVAGAIFVGLGLRLIIAR
jgi:hypothetical protein